MGLKSGTLQMNVLEPLTKFLCNAFNKIEANSTKRYGCNSIGPFSLKSDRNQCKYPFLIMIRFIPFYAIDSFYCVNDEKR